MVYHGALGRGCRPMGNVVRVLRWRQQRTMARTLIVLSFANLLEAHILLSTRARDIPLSRVGRGVARMRDVFRDSQHPLLEREFYTVDGCRDIFIRETAGDVVNVSRDGQGAVRQILEKHLRRIEPVPSGRSIGDSQLSSTHSGRVGVRAGRKDGKRKKPIPRPCGGKTPCRPLSALWSRVGDDLESSDVCDR